MRPLAIISKVSVSARMLASPTMTFTTLRVAKRILKSIYPFGLKLS